jgi:chromosome segregation ATPase
MHDGILRVAALAAAVICCASAHAGAQPAAGELVVTTGSGAFRMPPLSSLVNDTALLDAGRAAEQALPSLRSDALTAAKEIDTIDADIAVNAAAMEKEKEVLARARLELQPSIEAYTSDQAALRADDEQLVKDQAPVRALIDTYNRTPEKERTAEQYDRIAALKAPFDSRFEALRARKEALKVRFDAIEEELTAQEQPLAGMRTLDLDLLARRKAKTEALGNTYRALRAVHDYAAHILAELEKSKRTPPPALAPLLDSAGQLLKTLSDRGFAGAKKPATTEAPPR